MVSGYRLEPRLYRQLLPHMIARPDWGARCTCEKQRPIFLSLWLRTRRLNSLQTSSVRQSRNRTLTNSLRVATFRIATLAPSATTRDNTQPGRSEF